MFMYVKLIIYKETILMSNKTTNYLLTNINKDLWRKFKGKALLSGFNNAGECLRSYIESYSEKKSND